MNENKLHICAMSDLHGHLPKGVPVCDVVCICGDIVPLDYQHDTIKSVAWFIEDFTPWAESLPCDRVIFIGGNHDFFLHNLAKGQNIDNIVKDSKDVMQRIFPGGNYGKHKKIVYLFDNSYEYKGKRFYGTPWISDLSNWAFYANYDRLKEIYSHIPKNCDVLLTHMPPTANDCGLVMQPGFNYLRNFGSDILTETINTRNIKWALCGHVHSGRHTSNEINGTNFVNVSLKDEDYRVSYDIFEFDV